MAARADIARRRFVAWAAMFAAASSAPTLTERIESGIYRTYVDSERGDTGIGRATAKKLTTTANLPAVSDEVRRVLAGLIIAEGA